MQRRVQETELAAHDVPREPQTASGDPAKMKQMADRLQEAIDHIHAGNQSKLSFEELYR